MRLAIAGGAARVAHHHGIAGTGVDLGLVEEAPAVLRERPTVDHQQHRVRAGRRRPDDPAVHGIAVGCRCRDLLLPVDLHRLPIAAAPVGQLALPLPADVDVAPGRRRRDRGDHDLAGSRRADDLPFAVEHDLGLAAVERHPQQLHGAAMRRRKEHPGVAERDLATPFSDGVSRAVQQRPRRSTRHRH